jgi:hypothetical protein
MRAATATKKNCENPTKYVRFHGISFTKFNQNPKNLLQKSKKDKQSQPPSCAQQVKKKKRLPRRTKDNSIHSFIQNQINLYPAFFIAYNEEVRFIRCLRPFA